MFITYSKTVVACDQQQLLVNMSLSREAVKASMSHMKPASSRNIDSVFPLQFSLPYFV